MRALPFFLGGLLLAGVAAAQTPEGLTTIGLTGDPAAGKALVGQCRTCHGNSGIASNPQAPNIAGQPVDYLMTQLAAFRDGARSHEMMTIVSKDLTDQQIADLSTWYAAQKITATVNGDTARAPELCSACHGADGIAVEEGVPHLAGTSLPYILEQTKAFTQGTRTSEIMTPIAQDLSPEDIRAAAEWYSRIRLTASAP